MFVLLVLVGLVIYGLVVWAEPILTRFGLLVWMTLLTACSLFVIVGGRWVGLFQ